MHYKSLFFYTALPYNILNWKGNLVMKKLAFAFLVLAAALLLGGAIDLGFTVFSNNFLPTAMAVIITGAVLGIISLVLYFLDRKE